MDREYFKSVKEMMVHLVEGGDISHMGWLDENHAKFNADCKIVDVYGTTLDLQYNKFNNFYKWVGPVSKPTPTEIDLRNCKLFCKLNILEEEEDGDRLVELNIETEGTKATYDLMLTDLKDLATFFKETVDKYNR